MTSSATRTSRAVLGALFAVAVLIATALPGSAKPAPEKIFALEVLPNNGPFATCTGGTNANWANCVSYFTGTSADMTARLVNRSPGGNANFSSFDVYVPSAFTVNKTQTTSADVTGTNGTNASAVVTFPTSCTATSGCTTVRVGGIDTVKQNGYVQIAIRVSLSGTAPACGVAINSTSKWAATAYAGTFSTTTFRQLKEDPSAETSVTSGVVSAAQISHYLTTKNNCNDVPVASGVNITGTPNVGQVLTGHYTYTDAENDPQGTSTFRWLRDGVAITGATATTYTLVSDDAGHVITFEVTPVASTGTSPGAAATSAGVTVNSPPVASSVNITGTHKVGDVLTGHYTYTDADSDPEGTSTFRWLRDGVAITGATSITYTLVSDDAGHAITFEVTPVASSGSSPGTAVTSASITGNSPPVASSVNITGTPNVGQVLTGHYTYSDADSDAEGTSTFRWLRDGTAISGETSTTYTVVPADAGHVITFEVTPVASTGTSPGTAVTSAGVTINSPPVASSVNITGTVAVGQVLTGHYTYSDADSDAEGTSTFRWLRDGSAISGATSTTYTVVPADSGHVITFEVTPVAATGASPGAAVTSTGVTIPWASSLDCGQSTTVGSSITITNVNDGDCETAIFTASFDGSNFELLKPDGEQVTLQVNVNAWNPELAEYPVPATQVSPPGAPHDGKWCNEEAGGFYSAPGTEQWCLITQSTVLAGHDDGAGTITGFPDAQLMQVNELWQLDGDATLCRTCK
jgi:hypothetical protein